MGKSLVIVESPSKAKTIKKYLGQGFEVTASVGHVKDLPKNKLGVDVETDFAPEYVTIRGKAKVLKEIRKMAKGAEQIYLAPDPDREGEAIAWHLADEIRKQNKKTPIFRILINEITKKGVQQALSQPRPLNQERYESQQARRILDRLVGYSISPLLWDKVKRGLSAGRVQSVAVRLIVDREREIEAFVPKEYWSIEANLLGNVPPDFWAKLFRVDGKKFEIGNEAEATALVDEAREGQWSVAKVTKKARRRNPPPPFTTSKLQQAAAKQLRFTARRTMQVAQKLYEGIDLGDEGAVGLITYMRTDSTRISDDALKACRSFIEKQYGKDHLSKKPRQFKAKKGAQDAHEAIRPTSMDYPPVVVKKHLNREQYKLYELIWKRFVACQMAPAVYDGTTIDIAVGRLTFRATGSILKFAGYLSVYNESPETDADRSLPDLAEGATLDLKELKPNQHFTQPPPRFSEATLVKELEEQGIGRPSTYASIISTIQSKDYVEKDKNSRFSPTELGTVVTDLLVESFPRILDVGFTAAMEQELDGVEEGDQNWIDVLQRFYGPFESTLEDAKKGMRNLKRESIETDIDCEKCDQKMVIKWGKNGYFLACSGYPDCRNTSEFVREEDGTIKPVHEEPEIVGDCDKCDDGKMVVKSGRYGRFLACTNYPDCKNTKGLAIEVPCPKCASEVVEKRSRKGKTFYGCSSFPKCKYASWDLLIPVPCKECEATYLLKKERRGGSLLKCAECETQYPVEYEQAWKAANGKLDDTQQAEDAEMDDFASAQPSASAI